MMPFCPLVIHGYLTKPTLIRIIIFIDGNCAWYF